MKIVNHIKLINVFFLGLLLCIFSCNKEKLDNSTPLEKEVGLNKTEAELFPGDELVLKPKFDVDGNLHRTYYWSTDNPRILDIDQKDNLSAKIIAKRLGKAKVTLRSTDGDLEATCEINIIKSEAGGITRILTIGNGFSEDAVEKYLYDLAKKDNRKLEIGNLYLKEGTLEMHNENAINEEGVYQLRMIDQLGNKSNESKVSLETAITSDDWDFISFQQEASLSGIFNSYSNDFPGLFDYVKDLTTNPEVKFLFHQTWAYPSGSNVDAFQSYGNDQMTMYDDIVDAVNQAANLVSLDNIVPTGTAIQNGRTSFIGEGFCKNEEGRLSDIGKYTAACTWFEIIFGKTVVGNEFVPKELSAYESEIAQHAAHEAVKKNDEVTDMIDYKEAPFLKNSIFIGFGSESVADGWNVFLGDNNQTAGKAIIDMVNEDNRKTNFSIEITESFNGRNNNGVKDVSTDFEIPSSVSEHSYFGNGLGVWDGKETRKSSFKISGLNKNQILKLCFFGSRDGVGDNRETKYEVEGNNKVTVYLNTSNNGTKTVCANGVKPDNNGEITVILSMGNNNNNGNGFFYINAVRLAPFN